jgi:class 3 adenylate cyclase/ABC-type glycerol-3-phosphate transport system substrate-binding protein
MSARDGEPGTRGRARAASRPGRRAGRGSLRVAAALLVALLVSAAGAAPAEREGRRLRVAFSRIEAADVALIERQADRFAATVPGLEVEVVVQQWRTTDVHDLWARYLALGDPSIDVYVIDDPWVAEFAFAGWIRPLDELRDWAEQELHPAGLRTALWRDRLYAVPMELSANALFCRKDLLEAASLRPPETLEDLFAQARRLREVHGLPHGLLFHVQFAHNDVYPLLWASGGGPLANGRVALADPVNARVLSVLQAEIGGAVASRQDLERWSRWPSGYHTAVEAFGRGEAAFMVNWLRYEVEGLDPGQVAITPIPGLAGHRPGTGATLGSWFWAVNAASRDPVGAAALIRALTSPEAVAERFEALGTFPPLRRFYEDAAWAARHPALAVAAPIFANARPRLPLPNEREVNERIEEALHRVLLSGEPVEAALAEAAHAATAAVEAFPREPRHLPDADPPGMHAGQRGRGVLLAAGLVWLLAIALGGAFSAASRRRGGLFRRLSTKVSVLGLTTLFLALTTGTAVALSVVVQSQEEAIHEAEETFRASIREHTRSLGRQIALGASVVRELSDAAGKVVVADARARAGRPGAGPEEPGLDGRPGGALPALERTYEESLYVLAAEGAYNRDILFLQLLAEDGTVLASERDFLSRDARRTEGERRRVEDPTVRDVARFGRRLSMRDVPAGADLPAHLEVMVPLVQSGRHAGAVRIAYSKLRQEQRIGGLRSRQEELLSGTVLLLTLAAAGLVGLGAVLLILFARSVTRPIVLLTKMAERVGAGDLTVSCEVPGRDEVASLGRRLNQMVVGLREREQIREMFGRYVGSGVSSVLLSGRVELGGEERVVTVLFSDVRTFTALSEALPPPDVVRLLNVYFEQMVDAVFAHGGMLDKFIGDGLMAVFGAPADLPDHAAAAARCALDMRERLQRVNDQLRATGLPALSIGIGLHTGPVVMGNIGSSKRAEYTAVGDTVNLAARLESQTKDLGRDVLLSGATESALVGEFETERIGEIHVKGKRHAVVVYGLRGLHGAA